MNQRLQCFHIQQENLIISEETQYWRTVRTESESGFSYQVPRQQHVFYFHFHVQ